MYARKYIGMWACMRVCLCLCAGGQGERVVGGVHEYICVLALWLQTSESPKSGFRSFAHAGRHRGNVCSRLEALAHLSHGEARPNITNRFHSHAVKNSMTS